MVSLEMGFSSLCSLILLSFGDPFLHVSCSRKAKYNYPCVHGELTGSDKYSKTFLRSLVHSGRKFSWLQLIHTEAMYHTTAKVAFRYKILIFMRQAFDKTLPPDYSSSLMPIL